MEIIGKYFNTVDELIDALHKLPKGTSLTPCGNENTILLYDPDAKIAYLDDEKFLEEEFNI